MRAKHSLVSGAHHGVVTSFVVTQQIGSLRPKRQFLHMDSD
jgi:hypothetical protein